MNQILEPNNPKSQTQINIKNNKQKLTVNSKKIQNSHKTQFVLSSFTAIIFILIFFVNLYKENKSEEFSSDLISNYRVATLYSNTIYNAPSAVSENTISNFTKTPFVIGMIKIDKINVNYPIISESSYDTLKISLSRFAGPMPNQVGNLCIAGHNYVDYKLFSRLNELEVNDKVYIYDLSGNLVEYSVYDKYEVKPNNLSCTTQETNGKKIVTLVTCNNVNGKRLVVKAKEL